jgi:hypothetical protein
LGVLEPRSKIWSSSWFLCRVVELLRLAFRSCIYRLHHVRARHPDVFPISSELRNSSVAYLRHAPFDHLDLHCGHDILQQIPTISTTIWTLRCARWRFGDDNSDCGHAKATFGRNMSSYILHFLMPNLHLPTLAYLLPRSPHIALFTPFALK